MFASTLAAIQKFVRAVRGAHSVDDIVGDFKKKLEKLNNAAKAHAIKASVHDAEIIIATRAKELAVKEKARAHVLADRIKALVDA